MKVPSTMSPQEEMSGKRFFYPLQIMRSSSPIFGMPFTSMALSFMLSFSSNYYHLIVETPKANLSPFMHALNSSYTTYFNLKRRRAGHLFQGRYKAFLIDVDNYLLELSRYLHMNPVRAGITARPEGYPYSSFRSFVFPKEETMVFRDLIWDMISSTVSLWSLLSKRSPEVPLSKCTPG